MKIIVRITPNSKRSEVTKESNLEFKVKVDAPPVQGKANRRLVEILAEYFGISKSRITIIAGLTARTKIVSVE